MEIDHFQFIPFKGISQISFGMSRATTRNVLGVRFMEFLRNEFSENTTDYYQDLKMFLEFDKNNICQAIEFVSYNYLIYEGENLFDLSYYGLLDRFNHRSSKKEIEDEVGVTYFDLGFGASKSDRNDALETIIIFSDKYW